MEAGFQVFFLLFTASLRSQQPEQTLVPGVFFVFDTWKTSDLKTTIATKYNMNIKHYNVNNKCEQCWVRVVRM